MTAPDPLAVLRQLYATAREQGLTLTQIQRKAGISRQWSSQFLRGEIADPGSGKVTRYTQALRSLISA